MPRAHIATKQATYTLDMLHRELAGKVQQNKAEAERLHEAMKHVEAVIKLLNPAHKLNRIAVRRRKPNPYFKRGTVFRAALEVLRRTDGPLTAHDVALAMLDAKGVKNAPAEAVRDLEGAVRASLRGSDAVVGIGKHPTQWRLTNDADKA
ncbi:MAG TPA: hypothetical protein VGV41_04610 [Pseudolabrys sp.]|uniref:hypothetical protein n=1 Tax=Pseudolabrys sp. TaxID=1960880 RepID=UPI002DDD5BCD|nr:hypothetical protein [Pseudolabrys sp.]HEV2627906.1 hypothetical protein [Pseudolabrys sp.]